MATRTALGQVVRLRFIQPRPLQTRLYSPIPTRHAGELAPSDDDGQADSHRSVAGPRTGRARPAGKLSRVPREHGEPETNAVVPEEQPAAGPSGSSNEVSSSQGRPWTPPFPTTGKGDTSYDWASYDAVPTQQDGPAPPSETAVDIVDDPKGVLRPTDTVAQLLAQPAIVVVRQLEMMNLLIGYDQASRYGWPVPPKDGANVTPRYRLLTPSGETVGYLLEQETGIGGALTRQLAGTHRSMTAIILDVNGREVLRMRRPFNFINSRIYVEKVTTGSPGQEAKIEVIGEATQEWHPWRRKYNLFYRRPNDDSPSADATEATSTSTALVPAQDSDDHHFAQFASINSGFLAWDFYLLSESGSLLGSINRNFSGFMREIFTDTGQMVVRFEAVHDEVKAIEEEGAKAKEGDAKLTEDAQRLDEKASNNQYLARSLSKDAQNTSDAQASSPNLPTTRAVSDLSTLTLDQRAVILATACSIDFDYFTRSHRDGLLTPPLFIGGMGGGGQQQPAPGQEGAGTEAGTAAGVGAMEGSLGGQYDDQSFDRGGSRDGDEGAPPSSPDPAQGDGGWSESPIGNWGQEGMDEGEALQDPWGPKGGDAGGGGGWFGWGGGDQGGGGGGGGGGWGDWGGGSDSW